MTIKNTELRDADANISILAGTDLIGRIAGDILGPKGAYKLIKTERETIISNDGATIFKNLLIDHPAAKMIINTSMAQDWENGDGTTSVVLLACELIREAKNFSQVNPINLIIGMEDALNRALEIINKISFIANNNDLLKLATTTLNSKITLKKSEYFAKICLDAVEMVDGDINAIHIIKESGSIYESELVDGFLLKYEKKLSMLENQKILLANTALDNDKVKLSSVKFIADGISDLEEISLKEREKMDRKIDAITKIDFDILINRQIIYDYPMERLHHKNKLVIENVGFDMIEKLGYAFKKNVISTFAESLYEDISIYNDQSIGHCTEVSTIQYGNNQYIKFKDVGSTLVLKGSSTESLEELERSIHDALCVLSKARVEKKLIYGGGNIEIIISSELKKLKQNKTGFQSIAYDIIANALLSIPKILTVNGGGNGEETIAKLQYLYAKGYKTCGINLLNQSYNFEKYGNKVFESENFYLKNSLNTDQSIDKYIGCMKEQGIFESADVKKHILKAAIECAQMIMKADTIVKCKPRERTL